MLICLKTQLGLSLNLHLMENTSKNEVTNYRDTYLFGTYPDSLHTWAEEHRIR